MKFIKLKTNSMKKNSLCNDKKISLLDALFNFWLHFDFSVLYVSPERWVFVKFRRNHRNYFWEGFTWNERVFWKCFNFYESN